MTVCFCEGPLLAARRQKALTSLEEVRWTQHRHRFEEDVRDLELRAPREEKHLRGRRPPRDSGGVDANPKVFSRLLIAGLVDTKFSGELHWYTPARTYPSDSEARPVGSDKRCREGSRAHLKPRSGPRLDRRSHEVLQKAKSGRRKKYATSREPACNEPLEPARER